MSLLEDILSVEEDLIESDVRVRAYLPVILKHRKEDQIEILDWSAYLVFGLKCQITGEFTLAAYQHMQKEG